MTVHLVGAPTGCVAVLGVLARAFEVVDFTPPILPTEVPGAVRQRVTVRVDRDPTGSDPTPRSEAVA